MEKEREENMVTHDAASLSIRRRRPKMRFLKAGEIYLYLSFDPSSVVNVAAGNCPAFSN